VAAASWIDPRSIQIVAGARLVDSYITEVRIPDALPLIASALVLIIATMLASLMPAARASRVDVHSGASLGMSVLKNGLSKLAVWWLRLGIQMNGSRRDTRNRTAAMSACT
jgi:hypothetical protein